MRAHILVVAVLGAAAAGCVTDSYAVTQAGTTPAPRPMLYDGQPLDRAGLIAARSSTVVTPVGEEPDGTSGNFVARHHTDVILRGARGDSDLGAEVGLAWVDGSEAAAPNLGPRPEATAAVTMKLAAHHSVRVSDELRLGLGVGMGFASVPVRISAAQTERDETIHLEVGVVPSYRKGPLAIFGGVNLTSEPFVPRTIIVDDSYDTPEVLARRAVVLSAGLSYRLATGMYLSGQLAKPFSELAGHGVQLDLGLGFQFGAAPAPRPDPGPPPGPYVPPPAPSGPPGSF